MKNHWLNKKTFQQKTLDETRELEKIYARMDMIAKTDRFIQPTNVQYNDCNIQNTDELFW